MHSSTDLPLDRRFQASEPRRGALVQDRPTLGSLPRTRRGLAWWVAPLVDLLSSSTALLVVVQIAGTSAFPALPVAPLLLVAISAALGVYGLSTSSMGGLEGEEGLAWPVIRLLMAAVFAWAVSLMTPIPGGAQLALWLGFAVLDTAGRALSAPLRAKLDRTERWVLVSDEATAERLKAYLPLRRYASIVSTVSPFEGHSETPDRIAALEIVDRYQADRVVIGSQHADDESLLDLVRAFKSIGVPVSLLPRPLDLLEAPSATPSTVGGVPLIDVEALAARKATPYAGPDRRRNRRTRVSVVVPAMNEEGNIGHVLREIPDDVHEVILVDGNSSDNTIEAAERAYPGIRVLVQSGRGKGDAFRTGFAAVTGNLVVMLDADGSADPAEIPRFVEALEAGADFAKGSRFLPGGGSADITGLRSTGNTFLSGTANLLHGTHFTDLCYGYNAFWTRCLPFIALDVPGFEVETLINLRIAGAGMKITEVPSFEADRISGQSNLKTFRDGFRVLGTILSEARRRRTIRHPRPTTEDRQQRSKAAATAA
jgi:Glycosyl transferase family 2